MDPTIDPTTPSGMTPNPPNPVPTVDDSGDSAPSAGSSSQAASPRQQDQPSAPATAPASALPPSRGSQVHGVLGGILLGALSGAAHKIGQGIKDVGKGLGKATPYLPFVAVARQQAINSREAQEAFEQKKQIAQQKVAQEQQKSVDEHEEHLITYNNATLTNHHLMMDAARQQSDYLKPQIELAQQFEDILKQQGIPLDSDHGAGHGGLVTQDAIDAAQGKTVHLFNGKTGNDAGIQILNTDTLNQPLQHDVKMPLKMSINPDTGKLEATDYQTIKADGHTTLGDVFSNFQHVQQMGVQAQTEFTQQQANLEAEAKAKKAGEEKPTATPKTVAETSIALADAKQALKADPTNKTLKSAVEKAQAEHDQAQKDAVDEAAAKAAAAVPVSPITDATKSLTGEEFVKSLPLGMQDIVRGIGKYQLDSKDLPRGKEKLPIMEAALHAYPSFDEKKYNERYQYLKEYGTSTTGDGATRGRLNTAVGHLDLLNEAGNALAQNNLPAINDLANKLGVATGQSPAVVYDAIAEKTAGEIAGAVKGGAGSATDPALAKAGEHLDHNMSPQQRLGIVQAQAQILRTMVGTMNGKFQSTMGQSPEDFGQPVLYGGNAETLQKMASGGGMQPPPNSRPVMVNGKLA